MGLLERAKRNAKDRAVAAVQTKAAGMGVPVKVREFAIIDVETTGLNPKNDRIVEIAVVLSNRSGKEIYAWSSLINPGTKDAGATRIHGIDSSWLAAAPTFPQITGWLHDCLKGRIVGAHNNMFDVEFLEAEYRRAGLPLGDFNSLCTMDLCASVGLPKGLKAAAASIGYRYEAHDALADARAATAVLARALPMVHKSTWQQPGLTPGEFCFPDGERAAPVIRQQAQHLTTPRPFLAAAALHAEDFIDLEQADEVAVSGYIDALMRALEDGYLDPQEQAELREMAARLGVGPDVIGDLHGEVVNGLLDHALEDRKISKQEKEEVQAAATWLGIDLANWDDMVKAARKRGRERRDEFRAELKGQHIAFSGAGVHPASVREGLMLKYGASYATRVADDTDLLVVGSEKVANQQTEKAVQAGIPVMLEGTFWTRLGEL